MSSSFFEFNIRDPSVWMISLLATLGVSVLYRAVAMMSIGARPRKNKTDLKPNIANTSSNYQKLEKHTQEFNEPKIISVCHDKIHVAIGYGLANAILIEGDTGCVLIDTLESLEAAFDALTALKEIIKEKPIEAIILTHFHADHTQGLDVFTEAYPNARIYAHETLEDYFQQLLNVRVKTTMKRGTFQFGTALNDNEHENSGIGYKLNFFGEKYNATSIVKPTHTFKEKMNITEAGIDLVLYHAPGETNDQIIVHWPEKDVLCPADNIYRAFPNLYAVRGTAARDTLDWVKAVDLMRKLRPKILVPQHTRPIEGQDKISEILTAYRDGIQLVHDQTVRYMNKGLYPDEITRKVLLPPYLANHPFLQEFYGTVEWSIKAVFANYMGWFSGKASELHPDERLEQSKNLIDLAGGVEEIKDKMESAFLDGNYQWALQLSEAMLDTQNCVTEARTAKINSLRQLALGEVSACGRNWYLTEALVEEGLEIKPTEKQIKQRINSGSLHDLFLLLSVMLDLEKTIDVVETVCFHFTDVDKTFVFKIRRGVMEILTSMEGEENTNFDMEVTTTELVWRGIMAKDKSPAMAVLRKQLEIKPRVQKLQNFISYFDIDT